MSNIRRYKSRNNRRRSSSRREQSSMDNLMETIRNMDPRKRIMAAIAAVFVVIIIILVIVLAATAPAEENPQQGITPGTTASAATTPSPSPAKSLAPSSTPSATPDTSTMLREGSEGDAVQSLNDRLVELGYLDENQTGSQYTAATVSAVTAFQRANGLDSDGICGSRTLTAIYSDEAIRSEAAGNNGTYHMLREGDEGDAVRQLQERLRELGYDVSSATGYYGTETAAAVRQFQTNNSLTADGIAGQGTQERLFSDEAQRATES